jgi:hypothetical protein
MEQKEKIKELREGTEPLFDINDRGFNVKAWYLKNDDGLGIKGDALIELRYSGEIIRELLCPSYKIYNIAAHFSDIVDSELSKSDKERGYFIAGSTGLGGCIMPEQI